MGKPLSIMAILKGTQTVLIGFALALWTALSSAQVQAFDGLAICRDLVEVRSETKIYPILIDPLEIFHVLNRQGETSEFVRNLAITAAVPFYKTTPLELEDARLEVLKWNAGVELIDEFSKALDWAQLEEKIKTDGLLETKELAILLHSFFVKCVNGLRESNAEINQRAVQQYEAALELNVDLNESALRFDNEYRSRTRPLAMADVDNLVHRRFSEDGTAVFEEVQKYCIDPFLETTFRGSLAEIDWLSRKIEESSWIEESEFTNRRVAFLNVLQRIRLLKPKPKAYRWTQDDIAEIKEALQRSLGELQSESILAIVSQSKHYVAAEAARNVRANRGLRLAESVVLGRTGVATGMFVTSAGLWWATRRLVVLEKGFIRSTSIYLEQMKSNLPEQLRNVADLDLKLSLAIQAENPVVNGLNLARQTTGPFREAFVLGQNYHKYVNSVRSKLTRVYGEGIASKAVQWVEADLATLGTVNSLAHERALANALNRIEGHGGYSLRAAEKLVRQQFALTPPNGFASEAAFQKAFASQVRSVHSKMLEEAESLLKQQYLEKVSGATTRQAFLEWMKYQSRKYWGRYMTMRKIRNMHPSDLELFKKVNPVRWWRDFRRAGEVVPEGAIYRGINPGESVAGTHRTASELGRSVLHKISWGLMLLSIGLIAIDIYEAWTGGKIFGGYGDLQAKDRGANPVDPRANEITLRTHHTKTLITQLGHEFQLAESNLDPQSEVTHSRNEQRLKNGTPQIEIVGGMDSLGGFNVDTGFFSTAYVIFKAYEDAKDGVREDRVQNTLNGILVRFQLVREGFDEAAAKRFGVDRDVPQRVYWVPDAMIDLSQLDPESRFLLEPAIIFESFRANTERLKIKIDPTKIQEIFAGATNLW